MGQLTNRFAAFTGNVILDRPLQDCTDSVLYTLDCCMKKSKKTTKYPNSTTLRHHKLKGAPLFIFHYEEFYETLPIKL
jgi:hypothetical protein